MGCPTVYEVYMVRYIVGFSVVIAIYVGGREVGFTRRFRMGTWDGTLLVSM